MEIHPAFHIANARAHPRSGSRDAKTAFNLQGTPYFLLQYQP
jgi:hypothetical protein